VLDHDHQFTQYRSTINFNALREHMHEDHYAYEPELTDRQEASIHHKRELYGEAHARAHRELNTVWLLLRVWPTEPSPFSDHAEDPHSVWLTLASLVAAASEQGIIATVTIPSEDEATVIFNGEDRNCCNWKLKKIPSAPLIDFSELR
jgi:hypothetical protein